MNLCSFILDSFHPFWWDKVTLCGQPWWSLCVTSEAQCMPVLHCVFPEEESHLCFILSPSCVLSIGLRVIVCVVGISEDRKRSASAPSLGIVPLHASLHQCCAPNPSNSRSWPLWSLESKLAAIRRHSSLLQSVPSIFC
jgi:hypothetical protein